MDFLSKKIQAFLEGDMEASSEGSADPYRLALWLWKRLHVRISSRPERDRFEVSLSEAQKKSWTILDQWWCAQYHPEQPEANVDIAVAIKAAEERQDEQVQGGDRAGYQSMLSYLFVVEMVWYRRIKQLDAMPFAQLPARAQQILQQINDKLRLARNRALKHATWQMIAHESLKFSREGIGDRTRETYMGSTWQPCPWLTFPDRDPLQRPAWLWDRETRKAVRTDSLEEKGSDYYCISHTWGRWREEAIRIEGVEWAVPTNRRVSVSDLPNVFHQLDWPVRYIWFDLFCIPQDDSPEQAEEIGKQAEIFCQAAATVIWMHDVLTWEILEMCIMWLGLNYVQRTIALDKEVEDHVRAQKQQLMERLSEVDTERILNPFPPVPEDASISEEDAEFHRKNPGSWWFSSLWTLQEAYLCPSALLASRDWDLLGVGSSLALTLDNLASLAFSPAADVDTPEDRPTAIKIMIFAMKRWELSDLPSPSRMSLLIAAESRQSTSPRAQAIMAALGTTDWFENFRKKHGRAPPENDLVFKLYPLEFLREAQHKIGGPFFLHYRSPPNTIQDAEAGEPLGTMLPLAHNPKNWQVTQAMTYSTQGWSKCLSDRFTIQLDGTVRVEEATIVYDSLDKTLLPTDGPISVSSPEGIKNFRSFQEWDSHNPSVPFRFAVAIVKYNYRQFGVVLEGVVSKSSHAGEVTLVKTAMFMTLDRWCQEDLLKPVFVDWRVL